MWDLFLSQKIAKFSAPFLLATALAALSGCSDNTSVTGTTTPTTTAASLQLSASPTTVKSDNSTTTTITVTAVDAGSALVPNTKVTMSADTGNLSSGSVTTGSTGTITLTFSSGAASKVNRTATITATVTGSSITAQIPVQIVGSTVTVNPTTATLPDDGTSPVTLTITAKDAAGNTVPNAAVTLSKTGTGNVTLTPSSPTTDANGQLSVIVAGAAGGAGTVTVSVVALGVTATSTLTVSPSVSTFAIDQQTLNGTLIANNTLTAMSIGNSLAVRVNAPAPTTSVVFATTIGLWNGTAAVVTVPVVAGKATATLTTTGAGVDNIQVFDSATPTTSDSLTVTMTAAASTANSITLQASPSVVSKSTGTTTGYSTLTASVKDINGYPVGGAPVSFEILNPTGGGETVSPVVVFSATTTAGGLALGEAPTTFASGSLSSGATGVQIRASVVGTAVQTEANLPTPVNATASGNDAAVIIGGTAGSVAFGQATSLTDQGPASTIYVLPMSVLVADSNGSPAPLGTVVNISAWPIAWNTGAACTVDPDVAPTGTFRNEDRNENLNLDAGEDGNRTYYKSGLTEAGGTIDGLITPPNSAGGTVVSTNSADLPGTATTNSSGTATFNLTYSKASAFRITTRIRAKTVVQGSDAVGEVSFRLPASISDVGPPCLLPNLPYIF